MNIATVRHLPIPEGESNHTLPYNNGVSLHVGPVRVLGGSAEADIENYLRAMRRCDRPHGRRMLPNSRSLVGQRRWTPFPRAGGDAAGAHRRHRQPNETLMMLARSFTPPYFSKNHIAEKKDMRSSFFGAVSSGSGHRSVGYHRPHSRRRSETKNSGSGPWDVGLCVVRVSRRDAVSGENRAVGREIWQGPSRPARCARAGLRGLC